MRKFKGTPQVLIGEQVHEVDRWLCNKYSNDEWCGILFYTEEGYIDNPDEYKIHVHAMYPMHIGDAASTEIENYGEVECYIQARPELDDMRQGFIHSHNNMDTFFSGTDEQQLIDSADGYDLFLSIITNNDAEYIARVSFPVDAITTKKGTLNIDSKSVGYLDCEVKYMRYYNVEDDILERIKDLDKAYEEQKSKSKQLMPLKYANNYKNYYSGYSHKNPWSSDIELFEPTTFFEDIELKQYHESLLGNDYDPGIVHSMYNDYLKTSNEFEISIVEEEAISRCTKEILVCTFNSFGAKHGDQIPHATVEEYVHSFKRMYDKNRFNKKMKPEELFEAAKNLVELYQEYSKRVVIESFVNAWQVIHDSLEKDKAFRSQLYNFIYCSLLMYISIESEIHYDPYSGIPYDVIKYYDSFNNVNTTYEQGDFLWY